MELAPIDWAIIVAYCVASLAIGVAVTRRGGRDLDAYFVADRSLPWWLAGTSIVATTFASDTPLVVSGFVRKEGIHGNWLWWNGVMGGMMCVVFFAHLWRRAGVLTDVELIELRYEGRPAAALRGFLAVYGGVLTNCITMMWVMLAMTNICQIMLGWPRLGSVAVLVVITLVYTVLSGLWGVVLTDLVQFAVAMSGSVALAAVVLWKAGGPAALVAGIGRLEAVNPAVLNLTPFSPDALRRALGGELDLRSLLEMPLTTFVLLLSAMWWGGGQGGGALAQRLLASRDERHSMLAALWFNFAHYVLRPWPWILVGLASLLYFPITEGENPEHAYPMMMRDFLPTGLRGLLVASFLAAFMSTIDTQLNWGSSYLVNDLYRRFLVRRASTAHYVWVSRLASVLLIGLAALAAMQAQSIKSAWIYLAVLGSGSAFVGLLRWYWWRVNAWSEISALAASVVVANGEHLARLGGLLMPASLAQRLGWQEWMAQIAWFYSEPLFAVRAASIIVMCTAIWVTVTLLTAPVPAAHLERFYRRVRPGGWWGPVARRCPEVFADRGSGRRWLAWAAGVACIYGGLVGVGRLCLARPLSGFVCLLLCVLAGWVTLRLVRPDVAPRGEP